MHFAVLLQAGLLGSVNSAEEGTCRETAPDEQLEGPLQLVKGHGTKCKHLHAGPGESRNQPEVCGFWECN